tara:strand:- start:67 stop:756 length:690 start_codon:yes stop_codon:yes gene_type:complete
MTTFSIIIPAYNEENYIRKTLHSIKQQSYQNYEIIVVANGCTDKTEEVVRKREGKKLRLLSLPKPNVSVARNAGALNAQGKILVFLDADTHLEKDSLKKIKEEFKDKHAAATTRSAPDSNKFKFKVAMKFKNFYNRTGLYKGCSGALICRKEDFHKVKGYNPELIVKEHRKLTANLTELGRYTCINTYTTTSVRRFENWGLMKASSFWVKQWFKDKTGNLKGSDYEKIR